MLSEQPHPALLERGRSAVLVIDVQEAFRPYVPEFAAIAREIELLARAAARLGVPVARSEQYPRGLGPTGPETGLAAEAPLVEKLEFAACEAAGWLELPAEVRDAAQVVLVGLEAHVCVRQTALALLARGREVHVAVDAVASHTTRHRDVALDALTQAGARPTTVEQVLFDWLRCAGTPEFRDVQDMLKQHAAS